MSILMTSVLTDCWRPVRVMELADLVSPPVLADRSYDSDCLSPMALTGMVDTAGLSLFLSPGQLRVLVILAPGLVSSHRDEVTRVM